MTTPHGSALIEIFHLTFLRFLEQFVSKQHYVLKGGCNLRFFFKSIRYSEDIDFDVKTVSRETLKKNVTKLLQAKNFQLALQASEIQISQFSTPKQTDTTQRWKIQLGAGSGSGAFSTKIEFSRRSTGDATSVQLEAVDPEITTRYRLFQILAMHYTGAEAYRQKLHALLNRTETQARDVFDLHLLMEQGVSSSPLPRAMRLRLEEIKDKVFSVDFDMFSSQVLAYLEPNYQEYYHAKDWDRIRQKIIEHLQDLR